MHNRTVRASLSAHSAFLAFVGINMRTELADCDSAELTGVKTSLSKTLSAVIRNGIRRQRALVAGRLHNLYDIMGIASGSRVFGLRETHALPCNFSFFIYAAAIGRLRAGNQFLDLLLQMFVVQLVIPRKFCHFFHNEVFVTDKSPVVCYHFDLLPEISLS